MSTDNTTLLNNRAIYKLYDHPDVKQLIPEQNKFRVVLQKGLCFTDNGTHSKTGMATELLNAILIDVVTCNCESCR